MPFTFSHPAAVLPLHYLLKKRTSITGLMAGSLVPDFEYFFRIHHKSYYSHSWAGLFWIDLPAGLALCFLFHQLIRQPLFANAPLLLKQKMAPYRHFAWKEGFAQKWATVMLCILAGAASHLLWDKLTHRTVPLVQQVSGVEKIVIADRDMTYYLFWDINSLIGVLLMLYFFWMLPAEKRARPNKNIYRYWLCLLAFIPVFFALLFPDIKVSLANVTITAINSVLLSLVVTSVVFSFPARSGKQALIRAGKKEGQRNRYPSVFNK